MALTAWAVDIYPFSFVLFSSDLSRRLSCSTFKVRWNTVQVIRSQRLIAKLAVHTLAPLLWMNHVSVWISIDDMQAWCIPAGPASLCYVALKV